MPKIVIGKPISKEEDLLRTKFPALFNHPVHWKTLTDTLKKDGEDVADTKARKILKISPILGNRNKTAVRHRIGRKEYLRFQRDLENDTKTDVFDRLADKLSKMVLSAADGSGTIPLHKSKPLMARVKAVNTTAYKGYENMLLPGVRKSIRFGLLVSMDSAQDGLERQKKLEEGYADVLLTQPVYTEAALRLIEAEKQAVIAKTSTVFKTIFDRVKKRRIKQGIFKNRIRGVFQSGFKLSQAVWNLRDENLRRLRNVVSSGIAQGRSAISMASEIKKMTTVGVGGVKGVPSARRGVYKSAFKNSLRLTRSETNNAYHEAELEYARKKGYKKKWNLAAGHLKTDICDELAQGGPAGDGVYPAELVPSLPHSNCSCYLTTVIPGIS